MPRKKADASNPDVATDANFRWTLENERKLLLLLSSIGNIKAEDHTRILAAFPGTSVKGVSVRTSLLRVEGRKLREEFGLSAPTTEGAVKTPTKKRAAENDDVDVGADDGTLVKPTPKRSRKSKKTEAKDEDDIPNGLPNDVDVKGEVEDEI